MIKKVPTDGIRKKSKYVGSKPAPVEDFSPELPEESLFASVSDSVQDSQDALERFMRRKNVPPEDVDLPKKEEKIIISEEKLTDGLEIVSSPEGDILIIEPPSVKADVFEAGGKKKWHMRWIFGALSAWVARSYGKVSDLKSLPDKSERSGFIPRPKKVLSVKGGVISGLGAVIIIFILLSTVFARFTVYITPRAEQINIRDVTAFFDVSVVKSLLEKKVIPAERLEFTRNISKEFETTGKELVEERARGKIKIYNRFSSSPQGLIANTRFVTDSGVLYRLTSAITIPGAKIENGSIAPQFIEAEFMADQVGTEANLQGEIRLQIPGFKGSPKYDGFYGVALQGFSGGFRGEARIVSKDDLAAAEKDVTKKIFDELRDEMKQKVPPEFKFVEGFSEIEVTSVVSPRVRTRVDRFVVEASARGRALIFRERDVRDMLRFIIVRDNISKKLVDESAELDYRIRSGDLKFGRVEVAVAGKVKIEDIIPRDLLAQELRGKKEGTIAEILKSRIDIAGFRLSFFPPWRASSPNDAGKIKLVVDGQ